MLSRTALVAPKTAACVPCLAEDMLWLTECRGSPLYTGACELEGGKTSLNSPLCPKIGGLGSDEGDVAKGVPREPEAASHLNIGKFECPVGADELL